MKRLSSLLLVSLFFACLERKYDDLVIATSTNTGQSAVLVLVRTHPTVVYYYEVQVRGEVNKPCTLWEAPGIQPRNLFWQRPGLLVLELAETASFREYSDSIKRHDCPGVRVEERIFPPIQRR